MKKRRVTYGVTGMMEYQAMVPVGKRYVGVLFSDGTVSAFGMNPATYTTESLLMQQSIERSSDYKRGLIKTIRSEELEEELPIIRNGAEAGTEPESERSAEADGGEPKVELRQMTFSCNDDAKDYLEETYGYVRSKLRNREDIFSAGVAHGIEIMFE